MTDRLRVTLAGFQAFIFVIGFIVMGLGIVVVLLYCYFNNSTKSSFLLISTRFAYRYSSMDKKVFFNTTVPESLLKKFKILAIELGKRQNQLLVEAIQDILNKYEKKAKE